MSVAQFFRGLFRSYDKADAFGDKAAERILRGRDVGALRQLFAGISGNWVDRYFYSLTMSRSFPLPLLQQWAETEPTSADAHLVLGARLLKMSWEARGYGRGRDVTEERAREFFRLLALTGDAMEESARLHPDDPTPWALLVMVSLYNNAGQNDEHRCFAEAVSRDPENWPAHMHRLMGLTE